ncbi:MAG: ATP-dependent metallopeptidase FtsH/Yme1/Tma family protein [Clostridia bacterium]|nr:ATP-dependent metallopeptidase FtsH/Yme1/Tma family protein [Clostridia bacterium]
MALIISSLLIANWLGAFNNQPEELSYDEFVTKLDKGEIAKVQFVGNYEIYILYKNSTIEDKKFPKQMDAIANISHRTQVPDAILEYNAAQTEAANRVQILFDNPASGSMWQYFFPIIAVSVLLLVFLFILNKQRMSESNKAMSFGTTRANVTIKSKVKFADVAGAEEEKEELKEIVDFLSSPTKFFNVGAKIPKGVLLVGAPGTGKTLFAKAVAGEANVPFFSISGSDFVEMFVGVGASRVRDLFAQAKRNMPCIVFIDEIDAVGRQRGAGLGGGHDEREQTLNQLLVQMDGFEANEGIIIIAATNRADILDPALLRPGRFDRQIYVHIPDVKGREAIFRVHSRNKPLSGDIDFKTIARITTGFTGADIANLLNEAAIIAARSNRNVIIMKDILEGINKVILGPQKKSRIVTESDKRITAYHEAGHAIVARVLPYCEEVQEVSIVPRGWAAGYTLTRPENDDNHMSRNKLNDMIAMMLAGRGAEEIIIKDISTGASSDIQRSSAIARKMVTEWGMSPDLGNIYLGADHEVFIGKTWGQQSNLSDDIMNKIDIEVKKIIDVNYQRALDVINENRNILEAMVKLLFEKETIYKDEVDKLFEGVSVEDILISMEKRELAAIEKNEAENTAKREADKTAKADYIPPEGR